MKPVFCLLLFCCGLYQMSALNIDDINIRDPFILTDNVKKIYYMYRTSDSIMADGKVRGGVEVFTSRDLKKWNGPQTVMRIPADNGLTGTVWAPEVHKYNGKYYLFATINSDIKWKKRKEGWGDYTWRGTQIFHADRPEGPFKPFDCFVTTPMDWMALDGTLWVENGTPYMVFCHEWVQTEDGTMEAVELKSHRAFARLAQGLHYRRMLSLPYQDRKTADDLVEFQQRRLCHRHSRIDHRKRERSMASAGKTVVREKRRARHDFQDFRRRSEADPAPAQQPPRCRTGKDLRAGRHG